MVSADDNGKWAYVVNYDSGERIDSVLVADRAVYFTNRSLPDVPAGMRSSLNDILPGSSTKVPLAVIRLSISGPAGADRAVARCLS